MAEIVASRSVLDPILLWTVFVPFRLRPFGRGGRVLAFGGPCGEPTDPPGRCARALMAGALT